MKEKLKTLYDLMLRVYSEKWICSNPEFAAKTKLADFVRCDVKPQPKYADSIISYEIEYWQKILSQS